jgi:hypothetical protein
MENLVEWMAREIKVLGENLPRRHFVHHKSHLTRPGIEPGRLGGWPATNRFSYGADIKAIIVVLLTKFFLATNAFQSDLIK